MGKVEKCHRIACAVVSRPQERGILYLYRTHLGVVAAPKKVGVLCVQDRGRRKHISSGASAAGSSAAGFNCRASSEPGHMEQSPPSHVQPRGSH